MIGSIRESCTRTFVIAAEAWNRFWFTAESPRLLGLMRILVGAMLLYTHLVWSLELRTFFADDGILPREYAAALYSGERPWTHFDWVQSKELMWASHTIACVSMFLFMIGWQTRVVSVLSCLFAISYAHRATGALFGLDQINGFLTLYLAIGPSGAAFSVDRWLQRRRDRDVPVLPSVGANISRRLIQVHLCVVYLFAGLSKLQGASWWNGEALWGAFASLDYQTMDLLWLAYAMWIVNLATLISLAWEISYPFMIWNPVVRPLYLALAVVVHLGIGLAMGMITFGLIMIVANMSFLAADFPRPLRRALAESRGGMRSASR